MTITISPDVALRLQARADAEGLTIEAYVDRIARYDEDAESELESLALEGLNSGESLVADDTYWEQKRRTLIESHRKER